MQEQHGISNGSIPNHGQTAEAVPNIIERVLPLLHEIIRQSGYQGPPLLPVIESPALPPWVTSVCGMLAKTIFKTTGTLKVGKELDFHLFGKLVGVLLRMGYAVLVEMPREVEALKLDDLPKEKQDRIEKALDLSPVRPNLLNAAQVPPDTTKSNDELLGDVFGLKAELLGEKVVSLVMTSLSQPPHLTIQFLRGLPEGYTMFLMENGEFAGDRGRTKDYMALLAFWPEIEALRADGGISRERLYKTLCRWDDTLLQNNPDRFEHLCEEIGLTLKKPGPPRKE